MSNVIHRHFADISGRWGPRQVHYRRAGSGPLLLLLHQSVQSSREFVPLMQQWSADFTVLAPDTPGYGLSDPLTGAVAGLGDFADATMEFLEAIGAGRFSVYGFHTGGMIAVALADQYPDCVTALVCNGITVLDKSGQAELVANYFPPFEPQWDGGHLTWLWSLLHEQLVFFPWYKHTHDARLNLAQLSPEQQQLRLLEFLRAGENYADAYRAAFEFGSREVTGRLKIPALITAARTDLLCPHLDRLEDLPECVTIRSAESVDQVLSGALSFLQNYCGDTLPEPGPATVSGRELHNQVVETSAGPMRIRTNGTSRSETLVVLHGAGGSSVTVDPLTARFVAERKVLSVDLPGHGESDYAVAKGEPTVQACAESILKLIDRLDLEQVDLLGHQGGSLIALALAGAAPARIGSIALLDIPLYDDSLAAAIRADGLPRLTADRSGSHLSRAWHIVRDGRLYFPWFRQEPDGIIRQNPDLDERQLQLEVTALLQAEGYWQTLAADQLLFDVDDALSRVSDRATVYVTQKSPFSQQARAIANRTGALFSALSEPWTGTLTPD